MKVLPQINLRNAKNVEGCQSMLQNISYFVLSLFYVRSDIVLYLHSNNIFTLFAICFLLPGFPIFFLNDANDNLNTKLKHEHVGKMTNQMGYWLLRFLHLFQVNRHVFQNAISADLFSVGSVGSKGRTLRTVHCAVR